jgi:hypothetical protein
VRGRRCLRGSVCGAGDDSAAIIDSARRPEAAGELAAASVTSARADRFDVRDAIACLPRGACNSTTGAECVSSVGAAARNACCTSDSS